MQKNAYKAAIKQPIALATIRENIRGLDGKPRLRTWKQMEYALDLMVANCVHFNGDDSHLSKTARGIRAEFTRLREKDAAAEAMAVVAPAEQATDFMPRLRSAMTETLPPRRCVKPVLCGMTCRRGCCSPSRHKTGPGPYVK